MFSDTKGHSIFGISFLKERKTWNAYLSVQSEDDFLVVDSRLKMDVIFQNHSQQAPIFLCKIFNEPHSLFFLSKQEDFFYQPAFANIDYNSFESNNHDQIRLKSTLESKVTSFVNLILTDVFVESHSSSKNLGNMELGTGNYPFLFVCLENKSPQEIVLCSFQKSGPFHFSLRVISNQKTQNSMNLNSNLKMLPPDVEKPCEFSNLIRNAAMLGGFIALFTGITLSSEYKDDNRIGIAVAFIVGGLSFFLFGVGPFDETVEFKRKELQMFVVIGHYSTYEKIVFVPMESNESRLEEFCFYYHKNVLVFLEQQRNLIFRDENLNRLPENIQTAIQNSENGEELLQEFLEIRVDVLILQENDYFDFWKFLVQDTSRFTCALSKEGIGAHQLVQEYKKQFKKELKEKHTDYEPYQDEEYMFRMSCLVRFNRLERNSQFILNVVNKAFLEKQLTKERLVQFIQKINPMLEPTV